MKKSKILLTLFAAAMAVGLVSCGGKDSSSAAGSSAPGSSTAAAKETVKEYSVTFSADVEYLDYLATYYAADSEILVNLVDGLVEHDEYGMLVPALAETWSKVKNSDGNEVYTFKLREGVQWVTSTGEEYAEVVADDFVAGMQHLLDTTDEALGYIVWGVIKGAYEYAMEGGSWADVGVRAKSKYEVEYTLEGEVPYFMYMMEYNPFMPMNRAFFTSKGGAFGVAAWKAATSTYGVVTDISSILYNGAFVFEELTAGSVMKLKKNTKYWDAANTTMDTIKYTYDDGSNVPATYQAFKNGTYSAMGVSATIIDSVKADNADKIYQALTNSTTYYGTFNLDRECYSNGSVVSKKTETQKADTKKAVLNKNFRKAVQYAFDKASWNGASVGEDLKNNALRNMLTAPEFVTISSTVGSYTAGTTYGEVVEAEYKKLNPTYEGTLADGQDAYYDATTAADYMDAAKTELGTSVTFPIHLDVVYYGASTTQFKQAAAFKQSIQTALGAGNVIVDLMDAATTTDYYAAGYRAAYGAAANYDYFYGSGWGPDYGDPLTYLNIFGYGNDMMTVIGMGGENGLDAQDQAAYVAAFGAPSATAPAGTVSKYDEMLAAAKVKTGSERYVAFAELEAYFLDTAVVQMTTTQGGNYAITRVQPRTIPDTLYGTDNEKLKHIVVYKDILTAAEVAQFRADWKTEKDARLANPSQYYTGQYQA